VVSVPAIGPKIQTRPRTISKGHKNPQHDFNRRKRKAVAIFYCMERIKRDTSYAKFMEMSRQVSPASLQGLCCQLPDSTGG
jgi:hypothetical protein